MNPKSKFNQAIESIKTGVDSVGDKYESHIRKKAIDKLNKRLEENNLIIDDIEDDDYEAMINDIVKDVKEDYSKKVSGGLLAFIGLDFLLG